MLIVEANKNNTINIAEDSSLSMQLNSIAIMTHQIKQNAHLKNIVAEKQNDKYSINKLINMKLIDTKLSFKT